MKILFCSALLTSLLQADPVILADFEGSNFGDWKTTGNAFLRGPAKGKIDDQQDVSGFKELGLVNTFLQGDSSTGSLTSPPFKIEHKFLTFLIGGGAWAGETCLNLIVGGEIVRTATGKNNENLTPLAFDLAALQGKEATIQIIDSHQGGWGHINIDHIVATDDRATIPLPLPPTVEIQREVTIDANFLQLPLLDRKVRQGPGVAKFTIESAGGDLLRFMHLKFPEPGQNPDFWYSADVREFKGQKVTFRYRSSDRGLLENLQLGDKEIIDPNAYDGPHRPQFHFSPRLGWMNDVNGTYYHNGLYHLFYQANPTTTASSAGFDMHWGHSVSQDLIHWEEWPIALFPNAAGSVYSGTAVMIREPIPGLTADKELPAPVLFFTGTSPFAQHFATTRDDGKSWQRFEGNPVLKKLGNSDRDPKVIWHEPSKHHIMVLYVDGPDTYHIFRSRDLQSWENTQVMPHWFECPEFFAVKSPTTGEDLYLLYGSYRTPTDAPVQFKAASAYQLGRFDGKTFTPVTKVRQAHLGPNFYAALTFQNEPKGRQLMMGWAQGVRSPGEPFNQAATVPLRMQLKAVDGKDTLCFEPAEEVANLRGEAIFTLKNTTGKDARTQLAKHKKEGALDIIVRFGKKQTAPIVATIRNRKYNFDPAAGQLNGRTLHPKASWTPASSLTARSSNPFGTEAKQHSAMNPSIPMTAPPLT